MPKLTLEATGLGFFRELEPKTIAAFGRTYVIEGVRIRPEWLEGTTVVGGTPAFVTLELFLDTTAPTLSGLVYQTEGDIQVTTDEAGTLYTVINDNASAPTVQEIKDSQFRQAQEGDDVRDIPAGTADFTFFTESLVVGTTYYAHCYIEDPSGNGSAILTDADTA